MAASTKKERGQRAREAPLWVAGGLGIRAQQAVILEDWNNKIVWPAPAPIVAKVGTSHFVTPGLSPWNGSWPWPRILQRAERPWSGRRETSRLAPTIGTS